MKNFIYFLLMTLSIANYCIADEMPRSNYSVNINSASADLLAETLDGIGLNKAQAIVDYRKQHGAFANAEALAQVKGIGAATVSKNKDKIRLK